MVSYVSYHPAFPSAAQENGWLQLSWQPRPTMILTSDHLQWGVTRITEITPLKKHEITVMKNDKERRGKENWETQAIEKCRRHIYDKRFVFHGWKYVPVLIDECQMLTHHTDNTFFNNKQKQVKNKNSRRQPTNTGSTFPRMSVSVTAG